MKEDNIDYGALLYAEEDKYIRNEIHNGTPETRKKWGIEDWKYGISLSADLISEKDCPTDDFSADDWKDIILESSPIVVQYCNCTKDVLAILTKEDFQDYDSWQICETIALGEKNTPASNVPAIAIHDKTINALRHLFTITCAILFFFVKSVPLASIFLKIFIYFSYL